MNWVLQRLAAALIAGIGFKLGSDIYDGVKAKVKDKTGAKDEENDRDEDVQAATTADANRDVPLEGEEVVA